MRVLIISSLYPKSYDPVLGCFVRREVAAIRRMGVDVVGVISPIPLSPRILRRNPRWRSYGLEKTEVEDRGGLRVLQPRVPILPGGFAFPLYGRLHAPAIRKAAAGLISESPVDLIHAHAAHPDGTVALGLAQATKVPVVLTIHGQDLLRSFRRGRAARRVIRRSIARSARVILVSSRLRRVAQEEGLEGRFEIIPHGISPESLPDSNLHGKLRALRSKAGRIVLSVGALSGLKGQEWVLRALGPGDEYWIVGDGPEKSRLKALSRSLGIEGRVRFFGAVDPSKVSTFMSAADVFALPSIGEAFGIVFLEAMRAGIPVVACRGEGESALLRHEETALLVQPSSAEAVSEALRRLDEDPELAGRLVSRAGNLVKRNFSMDLQCRKIVGVYEDVLGGKRLSEASGGAL